MSQTAPALADCLSAQLSAQGVKTPAGLSRALSELIAAVDAPERRPQALINANDTLRGAGYTAPILFLTAKDETEDKIEGLNAGGDDYVTKPFHIEEVAARMQALLRRNSGLASQVISIPPFQVDLSRRELSINEQPIKLTAFEYTIMETLIRNRGKVVSKDSLMLQLYPDAELRESHTIDVLMGRLRKKIQAEYPQDVITTVRGQGYLFELR